MRITGTKQSAILSQFLATFVSFGLFLYFFFHLMHGERGYFAWRGVEARLQESRVQYAQVVQEREELENRVKMLRPDSLNLDLLDERVRAVLGFVKPSEKLVIENP